MKSIPAFHLACLAAATLASAIAIRPSLAAEPAKPGTGEIEIESDGGFEFSDRTREFHFWNNVRVTDPGTMTLKCDDLVAQRGVNSGRMDSILARTNVVLLIVEGGSTNRATGGRAVYNATSETVVLTENPVVERPEGVLSGNEIRFDRNTKSLRAVGNVRMKFRPGTLAKTATNAPAGSR